MPLSIFIQLLMGSCLICSYDHRYLGFKKTVLLDRKLIVKLVDQYKNDTLSWTNFTSSVKAT
jgi:hypothetical protein